MEIQDKCRNTINLLNNTELFNGDLVIKMLESCCCTLAGQAVNNGKILLLL